MQVNSNVYVVMGVSGSGKSTVGKLLAEKMELAFYDADDYHPQENIDKMASGKPLNDQDRQGWLLRLNELILNNEPEGLVLACSALKEAYRRTMASGLKKEPTWIYLSGSYEEILNRIRARSEHFMPSTLLKSQFETLEIPDYAIVQSINKAPSEIIEDLQNLIQ